MLVEQLFLQDYKLIILLLLEALEVVVVAQVAVEAQEVCVLLLVQLVAEAH